MLWEIKKDVLLTDSILKTLHTDELNGRKVHLKATGPKANQLKHHAILILEKLQYDSAAIYVEVNDLLKVMPRI